MLWISSHRTDPETGASGDPGNNFADFSGPGVYRGDAPMIGRPWRVLANKVSCGAQLCPGPLAVSRAPQTPKLGGYQATVLIPKPAQVATPETNLLLFRSWGLHGGCTYDRSSLGCAGQQSQLWGPICPGTLAVSRALQTPKLG